MQVYPMLLIHHLHPVVRPETIRVQTPYGGEQSFTMMHLPGGRFTMGDGSYDNNPAHEVELSPFAIGQYPVTQALWEAVMGHNPSYFKGSNRPVECVDLYDAIEFCNALSLLCGHAACYEINKTVQDEQNLDKHDDKKWKVRRLSGVRGFRLPTEAEWEYAAQGGEHYEYAGSNTLAAVGWYEDNSTDQTLPAGLKQPNSFGLYDLSGNVWEWCQDWFAHDYYHTSPAQNPQGPAEGDYRVYRGGCWGSSPPFTHVAFRHGETPTYRNGYLGFRLAL